MSGAISKLTRPKILFMAMAKIVVGRRVRIVGVRRPKRKFAVMSVAARYTGCQAQSVVLSQSFLALAISLSVAYIFFLPEAAQVRAR
jgi:hypothetical protein